MQHALEKLTPGMQIPFGGDRVAVVGDELARAFRTGDRLVVVQDTGDLLHIPASVWETAQEAIDRAHTAFSQMASVGPAALTEFYRRFGERLAHPGSFDAIRQANQADIAAARERGRSTTRLELTEKMRTDMVDALRIWEEMTTSDEPVEVVKHDGWRVETRRAGLGVVGFVFEGRPNVFADATGVLRSGNTVAFRIGSDALGTARAILDHALEPARLEAGLPEGAVSLVNSPERSAGWALFSDPRLAVAVARGSGAAVSQLGAVARQAGIPVSLHGTGGAWMFVTPEADAGDIAKAVRHSLDRKVCNTLNTVVLLRDAAIEPVLAGLRRAAEDRGASPKLHLVGDIAVPEWWRQTAPIGRAEGKVEEPRTESIALDRIGQEWEWEDSPEITMLRAASLEEAVGLFNTYSPRFVASLISPDPALQERFYAMVDSPFVGNGFTRWVDGQYALDRPELGLSNWQFGRLFGRGGVLSGDSIYTIRTQAIQDHMDIRR